MPLGLVGLPSHIISINDAIRCSPGGNPGHQSFGQNSGYHDARLSCDGQATKS